MNGTDAESNTPAACGEAGHERVQAERPWTGPETQLRHTARNSAERLYAVEQVIAWMRQDILDDPPCPNDAATLAELLLMAVEQVCAVRNDLIGAADPVAA